MKEIDKVRTGSNEGEMAHMGSIYFVRHGQTIWNVENKICGATDIALTELGHQQAKQTGEEIVKQGIHADEILYSPLIRARDTALHISEITGIPAREEIRLKEQNFGKYESTPRDGEDFKRDKMCFVTRYEGGESMLHLAQRIYNLLDELKNDPKTYILVAHNGISRVVHSYFHEMTNEEYACFGVKNCAIVKYEFEDSATSFTEKASEDWFEDSMKKADDFDESLATTFMEEMGRRQQALAENMEEEDENDPDEPFDDLDPLERMEHELRRQVGNRG